MRPPRLPGPFLPWPPEYPEDSVSGFCASAVTVGVGVTGSRDSGAASCDTVADSCGCDAGSTGSCPPSGGFAIASRDCTADAPDSAAASRGSMGGFCGSAVAPRMPVSEESSGVTRIANVVSVSCSGGAPPPASSSRACW